MGKKAEGPQLETRAERTERLLERDLIPLTRREERAIFSAEEHLESLNEDLHDLD